MPDINQIDDAEVITVRARLQEQMLAITQQIKQNRLLPPQQQNLEFVKRLREKLKLLLIDWDSLNAELKHRRKLRDIVATTLRLEEKAAQLKDRELKLRELEIEQHEKTARHKINTERDNLNRRIRAELFYIVLCKYLDFEQREIIWQEVDQTYYNHDSMKIEVYPDELRNAVILDYVKEKTLGEVDFVVIANRYGVSAEVVLAIIKHLT